MLYVLQALSERNKVSREMKKTYYSGYKELCALVRGLGEPLYSINLLLV